MVRRRYSEQKKQEQTSRKQFEEYLELHEWITGDIDPDLGEDIFVRIYDEGISTGLSLYVQLKSVIKINDHRLKTDEISYSFRVDDLEHWNNQNPPVFLVVWDIQQRTGWWISVKDAIRFLHRKNPEWHEKESVSIRFPDENRIDKEGLSSIRLFLADSAVKLISNDNEFVIQAKFSFPLTPEGEEKRNQFEKSLTAGYEVELDGKYIEEFNLPSWWTRLYGKLEPKELVVHIGPIQNSEIRPVQFEFISENTDIERIPYVELRVEKQGFEEITLSNYHQNLPAKIHLVVNSKNRTFNISINFNLAGYDGITCSKLLHIQYIMAKGGILRLTMLKTGDVDEIAVPAGSCNPPSVRLLRFVNQLSLIQRKIGNRLKYPKTGIVTLSDCKEIEELATIIDTGRFSWRGKNITLDLKKAGVEVISNIDSTNNLIQILLKGESTYFEIWDERIDLGPLSRKIKAKLATNFKEIIEWLQQASDEDSLQIRFADPEITDEYIKWIE